MRYVVAWLLASVTTVEMVEPCGPSGSVYAKDAGLPSRLNAPAAVNTIEYLSPLPLRINAIAASFGSYKSKGGWNPWDIGDIVKAALVLLHVEHGRRT